MGDLDHFRPRSPVLPRQQKAPAPQHLASVINVLSIVAKAADGLASFIGAIWRTVIALVWTSHASIVTCVAAGVVLELGLKFQWSASRNLESLRKSRSANAGSK